MNGIELMLNFRTATLSKAVGDLNKFGKETGNVLSMVAMLNSKLADYTKLVPSMFVGIINGMDSSERKFMKSIYSTSNALKETGATFASNITQSVESYFNTLDKKYAKFGDYGNILKEIHLQETKVSSTIQAQESIKNLSMALMKLGFDADRSGKILGNPGKGGIIGALAEIQKKAILTGKTKYFDNFNKAFADMESTLENATSKQKIKIQVLMTELDKAAQLAVNGNDKALKSFSKVADQIAGQLDRINRKDGGMASQFKEFFNIQEGGFKGVAKGLLGWAGAIESIRQTMGMQEAALESTQRMAIKTSTAVDGISDAFGDTFKSAARVQTVMNATMDVAIQTGLSVQDAAQAMNELTNIRAVNNVKDLKDLGVVSVQLSQAIGLSTSEAANFIKDLKVIGGLTNSDVKLAANSFAEVQASIGLSAAEAQSASVQIGKMVRQMRAFGTTRTNIQVVSREVAKMTAVFEKVGLSASDANGIIDKMMDPDRINDNILLWNGLGMSAQQGIGMMMGQGGNMLNMTDKMVGLAKKLKSQYGNNIFALKQMAEAYGLSLDKVQALSSLTADQIKVQNKENALQDQANKSRASLQKSMDRIKNTLMVVLEKFLTPMINILTPALTFIADGLQAVGGLLGKMEGPLKVIFDIFMGLMGLKAFLWFAGGGVKYLKGIVGGFSSIGQVVKGLSGGMTDMVKSTAKWLKNLILGKKLTEAAGVASQAGEGMAGAGEKGVKGLLGKIKGKFGKSKINAVQQVEGAAGKAEGVAQQGGGAFKRFADALKEIKPAQLLALGAAILMIAAGIALIVIAVAQLAKAMKDLNLEQIIGLVVVVVAVMGGMVAMMYALSGAVVALGAAGTAGAVGMLAVGVAMLLIGAGVALIMLSIAELMKSLAQLNFEQLVAGIIMVVAVMGGMVLMMYALVGAVTALGIAGEAGAIGILAVGLAMLMIGAGAALAGLGFKLVAQGLAIIIPLLGDMAKGIPPVIVPMAMLAYTMGILAAAGLAFAISMVAIGATAIPVLLIMSLLSSIVGANFLTMAVSMKILTDSLKLATPLLTGLTKIVPAISGPLVEMAGAMALIAASSVAFVTSMVLIAAIIPILLLLSLVTNGLANNFYKMGQGIQMIAENAAKAIQGLSSFKDLFSDKNFSSLTADFTKQMESLANSTQKISAQGGGAPNTDAVVKEIQKSNELLDDIKDNTNKTNDFLRKMLAKMSSQSLASSPISVNRP
jgi:hypothetical protein